MKKTLVLATTLWLFSIISFGQLDPVVQQQMNERDRVYAESNARAKKDEPVERPKSGLPKVKNTLTKAELAKLKPSKDEFVKYANFLKQSDTGLIKLFENPKCNSKIIDVNDEKCLEAIQIIGNASFYSFKSKKYTDFQNRNIVFINGKFSTLNGNVGLITDFGDIELEKLDKNSKEIKALENLKLAETLAEIAKQNTKFSNGINIDGQIYKSNALLNLNSTYALRSLKYFRPYYFRPSKTINLEEIIVVFKVVNKNDDGSVTILWKEILTNKMTFKHN